MDSAPIRLTISSPFVPNLTLVDLPGLTKVAIDGQPESIIHDIEAMVRTYVTPPSSIILAVTPANQDLATSDALNLAKRVDPTGDRTVGVLTKVDLMVSSAGDFRGMRAKRCTQNQCAPSMTQCTTRCSM